MRIHILAACCLLSLVCISGATTTQVLDMVSSGDPGIRIKGFEAIKTGAVGDYACKFAGVDSATGKKAVVDLLRREKVFDFESFYRKKYSIEGSPHVLSRRRGERNVEDYLYSCEGYGEYYADLMLFVDSCQDETAVNLFPGVKTFAKYYPQSVEHARVMFEQKTSSSTKRVNLRNQYVIGIMGEVSFSKKKTDSDSYQKAISLLTALVEDSVLCLSAVEAMGNIGDTDLIPALEKISGYPETKGRIMISRDTGETWVVPISPVAKEALLKIRGNKHGNAASSSKPK